VRLLRRPALMALSAGLLAMTMGIIGLPRRPDFIGAPRNDKRKGGGNDGGIEKGLAMTGEVIVEGRLKLFLCFLYQSLRSESR
jgi:hypothetical protein